MNFRHVKQRRVAWIAKTNSSYTFTTSCARHAITDPETFDQMNQGESCNIYSLLFRNPLHLGGVLGAWGLAGLALGKPISEDFESPSDLDRYNTKEAKKRNTIHRRGRYVSTYLPRSAASSV